MAEERRSVEQSRLNPGPYLARIIGHLDPKYMGTLEVELIRTVGNLPGMSTNILRVRYLSPFYGVTGIDHLGAGDSYSDTQKSYGMWMIPPDPGTIVLVIFAEGDPKQGFWIGCVQDEYMNFMVPGLAATELNNDGDKKKPVGEYNKKTTKLESADTTQYKKPVHPLTKVLEDQGLLADEFRGITTSSARREIPSAVFGISTPGPIDKTDGAPKGTIGKLESKITSAFVSRLGGTTFVMDDGDDKFLRKTPASEGPPDYAAVEDDEKGGKPDIPHNELVRIRTRTGHQILLHNSEDLIYIGNARGTTWIELTSNGKIDIYAKDSVSIHTENDLNVTANRDINFTAGRNINMISEGYNKIKAGGNHEVLAANTYVDGGEIHLNSGKATAALKSNRIPNVEPWLGHENFNPKNFTPDKTEATNSPEEPSGELPKIVDTFKKVSK